MDGPIRRIRISASGKDQLIRLKRFTGIDQWNILCRWALCRSLAEPYPPSPAPIKEWSNIDMDWHVFGGHYGDTLLAMLRQRCVEDSLGEDDQVVAEQFRLHLHRGIATLAAAGEEVRAIEDLVRLSADNSGKVFGVGV